MAADVCGEVHAVSLPLTIHPQQKFIRTILSHFRVVSRTKGRPGATIAHRGVEAVPVAGVMVNSSDWEVHPKMEGVDFENAEKMHGLCGHRRR